MDKDKLSYDLALIFTEEKLKAACKSDSKLSSSQMCQLLASEFAWAYESLREMSVIQDLGSERM